MNIDNAADRRRSGFTLIELLTVIAIITLLISILVPSLTKARDSAKNAKTRAAMKAMGDGLDMFRNDNPGEVRSDGYPSSAATDDPTEPGEQEIFGAQWLVRYLMGKDLRGYVSRKAGKGAVASPQQFYEQQDWYADAPTGANPKAPLSRASLYLNPDSVQTAAPKTLPGAVNPAPGGMGHTLDEKSMEQLVALDTFGYPILYYAANPAVSRDANAKLATIDGMTPAVYNFRDNALFTGSCRGTLCTFPPWEFGANDKHGIQDFGLHPNDIPDHTSMELPENAKTFPSFILNREAYDATGGNNATRRGSLIPYRKDAFLLIGAGRDGLYGTADDVTNFR
jgi:prepilin-type N-terminal cleavage/methylation domain-containing protein